MGFNQDIDLKTVHSTLVNENSGAACGNAAQNSAEMGVTPGNDDKQAIRYDLIIKRVHIGERVIIPRSTIHKNARV